MPSTNKTPYLGLNDWVLEDTPEMDDYNQDNQILDAAVRKLSEEKANENSVAQRLSEKVDAYEYIPSGPFGQLVGLMSGKYLLDPQVTDMPEAGTYFFVDTTCQLGMACWFMAISFITGNVYSNLYRDSGFSGWKLIST